ncbi:hypothetical protein XELAEV_18021482mg [Xenopus laevis]|uniref:Interleukin-7 n=1 Tax=Xenopus laevis TaxID=8355 RepID=A0A974HRQ3_XENLA|nr:hypothetical protein XELAEV_18021482mg [Xenopus laevis]
MFRHIEVNFLLLHCFGAFVFAQGATHIYNPKTIINEIICDIDHLEKHPQDLPPDYFEIPKKATDDKCLTSNMNAFEKETNRIHLNKTNEKELKGRIYKNLKCLQAICSRLNNTNEHGICEKQQRPVDELLTELKIYLRHVFRKAICHITAKTYEACR